MMKNLHGLAAMRAKEKADPGYHVYESTCPGCGVSTGHVGKKDGKHTPYDPKKDNFFCSPCAEDPKKNPPRPPKMMGNNLLTNLEQILLLQQDIEEKQKLIKESIKALKATGE